MGLILLIVLILLGALYKLGLQVRLAISAILSLGTMLIISLMGGVWGLATFICGITVQVPIILSLWAYVLLTEIIAKRFKCPARYYLILSGLILISALIWWNIEHWPTLPCDFSM